MSQVIIRGIIRGIINIVPYCIIKLYKNVNVKMSQKCKRRYEKAKKWHETRVSFEQKMLYLYGSSEQLCYYRIKDYSFLPTYLHISPNADRLQSRATICLCTNSTKNKQASNGCAIEKESRPKRGAEKENSKSREFTLWCKVKRNRVRSSKRPHKPAWKIWLGISFSSRTKTVMSENFTSTSRLKILCSHYDRVRCSATS